MSNSYKTAKIKVGRYDLVGTLLLINIILNFINYSLIVRDNQLLIHVIGEIILINRFLYVLLWLAIAIIRKKRLFNFAIFTAFIILVALEYIYLRQWILFDVFFLPVFFGEYLKFEKVRKLFLNTFFIGTIVLSVLSLCGFFSQYYFTREGGSIRYSLGFAHPNLLGVVVLCMCFLFLLRERKQTKSIDYFLLLFCAAFLWIVPNSMTNTFLLILCCVLLLVTDLRKNRNIRIFKSKNKKNKWCTIHIYILIALGIGILYGMIYQGWGREVLAGISGTFYSRFVHAYNGLRNYGICLFGNKNIEFIGELDILQGRATDNQYFALDCLYVYLPVVVGIVPTITIGIIYAIGIRKCVSRKNNIMLLIMLLFLLSAVSDSILVSQMCAWIYFWIFSITREDTINQRRGNQTYATLNNCQYLLSNDNGATNE